MAQVPLELSVEHLAGWGTGRLFRSIIHNEIGAVLSQRNGGLSLPQQFEFEQIFNCNYQDGARMLTVGGVLFDRGQRGLFENATFGDLEFVRNGNDAFRIDIPKLTPREIMALQGQMPPRPGTVSGNWANPAK